MFAWIPFLDQHQVEYVTSGRNVSRGHIAIRCPFCGHSDPSQHMVISLTGTGWHCWRNIDHKGRSPTALVAAILGCSYADAAALVGDQATPLPSDLLSTVQLALSPSTKNVETELTIPKEFKAISRNLPSCKPYIYHLQNKRLFTNQQIDRMSNNYDVMYCTQGEFAGRIVFLVIQNGKLVGWTGRTIGTTAKRYKAEGSIIQHLLWYDNLVNSVAHTICLVEGPFDALKVAILGRRCGITATCLFTSGPSNEQINLLYDLLPRFKHKVLLLDQGTLHTALRASSVMTTLGLSIKYLPTKRKDPGEIQTEDELLKICA